MKLHPDLEKKLVTLGNEVHRHLFEKAKTMCLPFWWHGPTRADGQLFNNGTLCVVDTGERVLGVTAFHVYDKYLERLDAGRPIVCQFASVTVSPEALLIDASRVLDLATFDLSDLTGRLQGFAAHRPSVWPPGRPAVDDLVIYGGFPGNKRRSDLRNATFSLDTVTGLISDVTPQHIVVRVDYSRLLDADGPADVLTSSEPPGTSGGPVYRVIDTPKGYDLEIVGFIYGQSELVQSVLIRHADRIQANGRIQSHS